MQNHLRGNPESLSKDDRPFSEVQASPAHAKGGEPTMGQRTDPNDAFLGQLFKTFDVVEDAARVVISNNIRMDAEEGGLAGAAGKELGVDRSTAYIHSYNKAIAKRDATDAAIRLDQAINSGQLNDRTPEEAEKLYQELTKPTSEDETYQTYYNVLMGDAHSRWTATHGAVLADEGIRKVTDASFKGVLTMARKGSMDAAFVQASNTLRDIKNMGDGGKNADAYVSNLVNCMHSLAYDNPKKWDAFGNLKLADGTALKDSKYGAMYEAGRLQASLRLQQELEEAQRRRDQERKDQARLAALQAMVVQHQTAGAGERGIEDLILQGTSGASIVEGLNALKPYRDDPNYKVKQETYSAMASTYNTWRTSMFHDPVGTCKALYARKGLGAPSVQECKRIARSFGVPNHFLVMSEGAAIQWSERIRKDPDRAVMEFNQAFRGMENGAWQTLAHFSPQTMTAMIYTQLPPAARNAARTLVTAPETVVIDKKRLTKATTQVQAAGADLFNTLQIGGWSVADREAYQRSLATVTHQVAEQQGISLNEAAKTVIGGVTKDSTARRFSTGASSFRVLIPKTANVSQHQIDEGLRNFNYALTHGRLVTFSGKDGKPIDRSDPKYNRLLSEVYTNSTVTVDSRGVHYMYNGCPLTTRMVVDKDGALVCGHEDSSPLSLSFDQIRKGEYIWR